MIPLKELRLGNKVFNPNNIICEITDMYSSFKYVVANTPEYQTSYSLDLIEPIPLTPEILENGGLKVNGFKQLELDISWYPKQYKKLVVDINQGYIYIREGETERRHEDVIVYLWNRDLKKEYFVHQLQNLYFALTGEELEINL